MPPVTTDTDLPEGDRPSTADIAGRQAPAGRRRRRWRWAVIGVLMVAVGLSSWLSWKVLTVRNELTAAQAAVNGLRDGGEAQSVLEQVAEHSRHAAEAANDPLWSAAEHLPWVGDNLRAARVSSEALDSLAGGLAIPAMNALNADSSDPLLVRLLPVLRQSAKNIGAINSELQQVRRSPALISPLRAGVDQLAEVVAMADPIANLLPGMLGADGERNYLLVAQSNAETLALGGSAASQSLIRLSNGSLKIVKQADSTQYQRFVPVDVDIDKSAIDLYNQHLIDHINTSVGRPDWPTAARTISALWNRDIDQTPIDGVISVDPLALARVMRATGPVFVDGREFNSKNVVSLLLSEAYQLYEPREADRVFKEVALEVMDTLVSGDFDLRVLVSAITDSINSGSIMFWSSEPVIQELVAPWRLSGILPTTNVPETTIGVFFRDASLGSKIDYYLRTESKVSSVCRMDGSVSYTVHVTVWLDLTKNAAKKLPYYVTGGQLSTKTFRTQVFIYGPPGTKVSKEFRQRGTGKSWNWRPLDMTDLGRPTPSFMTVNPLGGERVTVGVVFTAPAGQYGPLQVRTTPMVHPTKVSIGEGCPKR